MPDQVGHDGEIPGQAGNDGSVGHDGGNSRPKGGPKGGGVPWANRLASSLGGFWWGNALEAGFKRRLECIWGIKTGENARERVRWGVDACSAVLCSVFDQHSNPSFSNPLDTLTLLRKVRMNVKIHCGGNRRMAKDGRHGLVVTSAINTARGKTVPESMKPQTR